MFKPTSRLSLALLLLFSAGVTASLRADTVGFPKDKPVLTVDAPAGWKIDCYQSRGVKLAFFGAKTLVLRDCVLVAD